MHTLHPFDLIIGLDRSDKKADLCLINTRTLERLSLTIDTSPEALWEWLLQLRQEHPQARIGLCLEQPAGHLIAFLEAYEWITLYPINPITLQKFRETFVTSRAKDDTQDAFYLAELLLCHADKLKPWAPEDSPTRSAAKKGCARFPAVTVSRTKTSGQPRARLGKRIRVSAALPTETATGASRR